MQNKYTLFAVTLFVNFGCTNVMASELNDGAELALKPPDVAAVRLAHYQPPVEQKKEFFEWVPYSCSRAFEVDRERPSKSLKELFYNNEQP